LANISTNLSDWSATAGSNQPDSSDTNTIQADLQAIQAAVKGAFPNVGGAVNATHTELNYVDGVTSAIQTQLNAKAASGANSDITSIAGLTTPLSVAQGGIGADTLTLNSVLLGNGVSAPQEIAPGTSGNVLTSNGITWASTAPSSVVDASETAKGIVELATTAEAVTGTDIERAVTPAGLKAATDALNLSAITLGTTQATTSGTTIDFGSIPAGVKQVVLSLSNVSFSANSLNLSFRLGTGGTPQSTGYESGAASIAVTANTTVGNVASTGFVLPTTGVSGSGVGVSGSITFTLLDSSSNLWACSGNVTFGGNPAAIASIAGKVALSGALDIVRIYGGTFDAGSANIAYL
jgi:hypothetical protein